MKSKERIMHMRGRKVIGMKGETNEGERLGWREWTEASGGNKVKGGRAG